MKINKRTVIIFVVTMIAYMLFIMIFGIKSWLAGDGFQHGVYKVTFIYVIFAVILHFIKKSMRESKEHIYYEIKDDEL